MQPVKNAVQKKFATGSFVKELFTDVGNYPIILANATAASMVFIFGGRKLFFHPDIGISDELRNSNHVQNETPTRLQDAGVFRAQTQSFARTLIPLAHPILKLVTGSDEVYEKWSLDFIINQPITTPLEQTNYFDDDYYNDTEPTEYALNLDNAAH